MLLLLLACRPDPEPEGLALSAPSFSGALDSYPGLPGAPNFDDDDGDGEKDWEAAEAVEGEDDRSVVSLHATGEPFTLRLAGDVEHIRVWRKGAVILDSGTTEVSGALKIGDHDLEIEFGDYLASATLTLEGEGVSQTVYVTAAPLILNHHLQGSDRVLVMDVPKGAYGDNVQMVDAMTEVLGDRLIKLSSKEYKQDVWVQDEMEFGGMDGAGAFVDLVWDTIRDRQLDDVAEDYFQGPGFALDTFGAPKQATSQDYGGNIEVSPPVTVDGVEYPFGRIYYGADDGRATPHGDVMEWLDAQKVQKPFWVDTSWLCVGHIDEYQTTIPDPSSPKGFKLVWSDTRGAWDMLAAMDPETPLSRYDGSWGSRKIDRVGALLEDEELRAYNDDIQASYLDPQLEIFKRELGLDDSDVILLPTLFEEASGCFGTGAALFPGMANLLVTTDDAGQTVLIIPDPFLREDVKDQSTDPLILWTREHFPADLELVFVDDFDLYHLALGEVHCGTNSVRPPSERSWWTDALHLLQEQG